MIYPGAEEPVADLRPARNGYVTPESDAAGLRAGRRLEPRHAADRAGDARLEARIRSYELAARMQLAAPEALDLSRRAAPTS